MGLFGTKKEKLRPGCCAGTGGAERTGAPEAVTGVKVLGSGCAKCNALAGGSGRLGRTGHGNRRRACDGLRADRVLWRHDDPGAGGRWKSSVLWQGAPKGRSKDAYRTGENVTVPPGAAAQVLCGSLLAKAAVLSRKNAWR